MTSKTLHFQHLQLKVIVVCTVLLLSAGGMASAASQSSSSFSTTRSAAFGTVYDQEFAYGYLEGQKYAARHDFAGYQYMLKHYRDAWKMYPQNGEFYRGRIDGLMAGYRGGGSSL